MEFTRGQKVYDLNGGEYLYADKVDDGHYVNSIVVVQMTNYDGQDFDEEETEGPLVHLREVYANPPKQKINDEITELSARKSELATRVSDLQYEERALRQKIDGYKGELEKEIKKYPHHQMFLHAANGGELIIMEKQTGHYYGPNWIDKGKLRFDIGSGKFEGVWDANMDGYAPIIAFKSIEDARAHFLRNYDLTVSPSTASTLAERYKALGIPLPHDLQAVIDEIEAEKKKDRRAYLTSQIESAQKALDALGEE